MMLSAINTALRISFTVVSLLLPSLANAESLGQFLRNAETDVGRRNVVASAAKAYLMTNASLASDDRAMIFCKPKSSVIEVDGYIAILERYAADRPEILGNDEGMLHAFLLIALKERFPCN